MNAQTQTTSETIIDGIEINTEKPWRSDADVFNPDSRLPQDRNLIDDVTAILERNGHPDPLAWRRDRNIILAAPYPPEGQLFLINRHWRYALLELPYDTMQERRVLTEQVATYSDWLRLFEMSIIPLICPAKTPQEQAEVNSDAAS